MLVEALEDLGGPGAELSTGLILSWQGRLVFGLDPRALALGAQGAASSLAFVGIGGHLEPDESWCAAVSREAVEEACCEVSLQDSPQTYLCRQGEEPQALYYSWTESVRPLLVWLATFRLARGPQRVLTEVNFVNAVFRVGARTAPLPAAEMTSLLTMDQAALLAAYAYSRRADDLLARGCQFLGEVPAPILFARLDQLSYHLSMSLLLAIETSCDETAAAVIEDGHRIRSNVVASQIEIHRPYGGVFPEIASRQHVLDILPVIERALADAETGWADLAAHGRHARSWPGRLAAGRGQRGEGRRLGAWAAPGGRQPPGRPSLFQLAGFRRGDRSGESSPSPACRSSTPMAGLSRCWC